MFFLTWPWPFNLPLPFPLLPLRRSVAACRNSTSHELTFKVAAFSESGDMYLSMFVASWSTPDGQSDSVTVQHPTSPPFLHPCFQLPHCASCALALANKWPPRSASHLTVHPTTMSPPAICSQRKSGSPAFEAFCHLLTIGCGFSQPPAPGQKRVKEDWENIWYFGMFGSIGLAAVLLYYKPDTRCAATLFSSHHNRNRSCGRGLAYKGGH